MTELASTAIVATSDASASHLQDPELATLLSKLAALQGHAVPAYLFGTTDQNASGLNLAELSRNARALEIWLAHFPQGQAQALQSAIATPGQFPLLWLSQDQSQARLLKGQLSSGACMAEDAHGQATVLSLTELQSGHALELKPQQTSDAEDSQDGPQRQANGLPTCWAATKVPFHKRCLPPSSSAPSACLRPRTPCKSMTAWCPTKATPPCSCSAWAWSSPSSWNCSSSKCAPTWSTGPAKSSIKNCHRSFLAKHSTSAWTPSPAPWAPLPRKSGISNRCAISSPPPPCSSWPTPPLPSCFWASSP
jgi:hypothetical protein